MNETSRTERLASFNLFDDAYGEYSCCGEVSLFVVSKGFQMESRAEVTFCLQLKKTAAETFVMKSSEMLTIFCDAKSLIRPPL
jgi:hypothetical protein